MKARILNNNAKQKYKIVLVNGKYEITINL